VSESLSKDSREGEYLSSIDAVATRDLKALLLPTSGADTH